MAIIPAQISPAEPFRIVSLLPAATEIVAAAPPAPTRQPVRRVLDLNVGESQEVAFASGARAAVRLVNVAVARDTLSDAVRFARPGTYIVTVERENEFGRRPSVILPWTSENNFGGR